LAEKWGATVTAVTSLLGAGTLIDADTAVRSLRPWAAYVYGGLVITALGCAAKAILSAAQAAQDKPITVPPAAAERLKLYREHTDEAMKALGKSREFAGLAFVLLLVSFLVRWFAPYASTAATAAP
jgi:hypothetical protein